MTFATALALTALLAAVGLGVCTAQAVNVDLAAVCEEPQCTVAGGTCTSTTDTGCCDFPSGQRCAGIPATGRCVPRDCSDDTGARIMPVPQDCLCLDSSECDEALECATDGTKANTCQVRRRTTGALHVITTALSNSSCAIAASDDSLHVHHGGSAACVLQ